MQLNHDNVFTQIYRFIFTIRIFTIFTVQCTSSYYNEIICIIY